MIKLEPVTAETKELARIERLYTDAFPANERRPFEDMASGGVEMLAFYDGGLFCGFACLLNTRDICHILYLAVEDELRGKGYGGKALSAIHELKAGRRVIADIERPHEKAQNNEQRLRRKRFYLRNGYRETPVKYRWAQEDYEILSYGGDLTEEEFALFWRRVRNN